MFSLLSSHSLSAYDHCSDLPKRRIHLQEIDSTQLFAKENLSELDLDTPGKWAIVTANRQINALGANGKEWQSSCDGNLYMTFVTLFHKSQLPSISHALQLSTLSVAQALGEYEIQAQVKLPNDVFVGGKKVSSCFFEIVPSDREDHYYLLIRIDINVNMTPEELGLLPSPSTSMLVEAHGFEFNKEKVLRTVFSSVKETIDYFLQMGFHPRYYNDIDHILAFKGERIEIELGPSSTITGTLIGLDQDGSFLVEVRQELWKISGGRILRVLSIEQMD